MNDHNEILRRIDRGETMAYVAAAIGTTRSAVAGVVRRARRKAAGLPATKRPRHQSVAGEAPDRTSRTRVAVSQARIVERERRARGVAGDNGPTYGISRAIGFEAKGTGGAGCRFPLWRHEDRPDGRFCGKRVRGAGEPYCAKHQKLTHQKSATSFPQDGPMVVGGIRSGGPVGGLPSTAGER